MAQIPVFQEQWYFNGYNLYTLGYLLIRSRNCFNLESILVLKKYSIISNKEKIMNKKEKGIR